MDMYTHIIICIAIIVIEIRIKTVIGEIEIIRKLLVRSAFVNSNRDVIKRRENLFIIFLSRYLVSD